MATARKTAEKTAHAVLVIENAGAALAEKFGLDIPPMPNIAKYDPDFGRALELEHLGQILTQILEAADAKLSVKAKSGKPVKEEK